MTEFMAIIVKLFYCVNKYMTKLLHGMYCITLISLNLLPDFFHCLFFY